MVLTLINGNVQIMVKTGIIFPIQLITTQSQLLTRVNKSELRSLIQII